MLPQVHFQNQYTLAYYHFKNNLTNLNDLFWFSECQNIAAKKIFHSHGSDAIIVNILGVSSEDSRRYPSCIEDYHVIKKNYEKWIKCNVIVSLSACFEVYLKSILTLSFKFDPGILLGLQGQVDGFKTIKSKNSMIDKLSELNIERATRGEWPARVSEIHKVLPNVAAHFSSEKIQYLEFIRKYRNSVSHAFDIDLEHMNYSSSFDSIRLKGVSLDRLKLILKNVIELAKNIDTSIHGYEISVFEYLLFIQHKFSKEFISDATLSPTKQIELRKRIGNMIGDPILGKKATNQILNFYNSYCSS